MMDNILLKILVCFIVYSLPGWLLLCIGLSTRKEKRLRDQLERNRTAGRIVDYKKPEGHPGRDPMNSIIKPVVEFTVYEQEYRLEYGNPMDQKKWPVGTEVEVIYDGNDPRRFHLGPDPIYGNGGSKAIRIGVIWILTGAAATLALAVFVGGESLKDLWEMFTNLFR